MLLSLYLLVASLIQVLFLIYNHINRRCFLTGLNWRTGVTPHIKPTSFKRLKAFYRTWIRIFS